MSTKRKTTIQNKIDIPWLFNILSLLPHCLKFVQARGRTTVISSQDFIESLPYLDFPIEV